MTHAAKAIHDAVNDKAAAMYDRTEDLALLWHFFEGSGVFGIPGTRFA
jgi:hypothetical protein